MTGESNFYEMDPNWKEEKRPKTTWGRTVMKELEEWGPTRGKAQAKDQNREDYAVSDYPVCFYLVMEGELGYINDAVNYTAGVFKLQRGQPLPDRLGRTD